MTYISLADFSTFGDVAAEDDAVLDYFLSTNAVERIKSGDAFLVLGRKGTGKTALVRYFTEKSNNGLAVPLNLRGYPWAVHAERIDRGASDIEAYVSSWRYLIAVELAAAVLKATVGAVYDQSPKLETFLRDNYGGTSPQISDILRPKKLNFSKISLEPQVLGNKLGGISLERQAGDHNLGLELNAISNAIMDAVIEIAMQAELPPISLHFDELDQGVTQIDDARVKMIIGLILAARDVRRECAQKHSAILPVVYLRTDIWDDLQFSDKNKIHQTLALNLIWTSATLRELVDIRLRAKLGEEASWDKIADAKLMRGSQPKWNHILARTFLRPRDVIKFLNATLDEAKRRHDDPTIIENKDIVDSRDEYSSYLKLELDDEIGLHWKEWTEALQACSAIKTLTFERDDFNREYSGRRSTLNKMSADEALAILYRFSVIGYGRRSGYGGSSWVFQYTDPEAGWDNAASRFKVHLGLKEFAKLRETRQ